MKLKKICCLFLVMALLFSATSGCATNNDDSKPRISLKETGYITKYQYHNSYDKINLLEDFVNSTQSLQGKYFFVINTEEYPYNQGNTLPPYYKFLYDEEQNGAFVNCCIGSFHDGLFDYRAPAKPKGCVRKIGEIPTCDYYYYAYATNNISTPLTFKHYIIEDPIDIFYRVILIYQAEQIVGSFVYYVNVPSDEYYEQFLKDNLVIIGENLSES